MKSDRQIQKDVMDQLAFDPSIHSERIGVSVEQGVVTLSGTTPSYAEKYAAEKQAFTVSGVRSVIEKIKVDLPLTERPSDRSIAKTISELFSWHVRVPGTLQSMVSEGIVTLKGEVDWKFQSDAAVKAVRNVKGVKDIFNYIQVRAKPAPGDIKKSIENALVRTAKLDAKGIGVEVLKEKVLLTGVVHSKAEADDIKWAAWATPGVTSVQDGLQVI